MEPKQHVPGRVHGVSVFSKLAGKAGWASPLSSQEDKTGARSCDQHFYANTKLDASKHPLSFLYKTLKPYFLVPRNYTENHKKMSIKSFSSIFFLVLLA